MPRQCKVLRDLYKKTNEKVLISLARVQFFDTATPSPRRNGFNARFIGFHLISNDAPETWLPRKPIELIRDCGARVAGVLLRSLALLLQINSHQIICGTFLFGGVKIFISARNSSAGTSIGLYELPIYTQINRQKENSKFFYFGRGVWEFSWFPFCFSCNIFEKVLTGNDVS